VLVPSADASRVTETAGGAAVPAERAQSVRRAGAEDGRVAFEVGSGRYRFVVAR
jgi:hypothetical protein